jgi:acetyl esterase/lipase
VDLTAEGLPAQAPAGDIILDIEWINRYARDYLAGVDAKTPLASPVFADLARLPPTLIQTGTDDILHGQALRLHAALLAAGNAVACEIIRDRWHAFQMLAGWLPSADAAIARAGQFIRRNIAP